MPPRVTFGSTWWGQAWVRALEGAATLDPNRLGRGRTYARNGAVGPLELQPGVATARVSGKHGRWYRVDVAVRKLASTEWEQVADAIAARAGHAAALLDGVLDPGIVDDTEAVDVRLLPGAGDLRTDCTCPDWAEPCKHAAAVCYLIADELDRDPFVLFLLRGMTRDELMAMVRERRRGRSAPSPDRARRRRGPRDDAVPAGEAYARLPIDDELPPLPEVVRRRDPLSHFHRAGHTPWDATFPPSEDIDPRRVDALALDAIERARAMVLDGAPSGLGVGSRADLARRAASIGAGPELAELAGDAGVSVDALRAWAQAWRLGGPGGVSVVAEPDSWSTDQVALEAGRAALVDMGYQRRQVALSYDSLRVGGVWLVIGPDGRWYALRGQGKHQELHLAAPPTDDVVDLADTLSDRTNARSVSRPS